MSTFIFASNNKGKIAEINQLVKPYGLQAISQADAGITAIEETGLTFIENALIKARHAAKLSGLPALADDSGLVVPALHNEPGLYSARYAGPSANDQQNIDKLLTQVATIPENQRQAYYYCALVFLTEPQDPCPILCEGTWHGVIVTRPRGTQGFGYDPVFLDQDLGRTAAQLNSSEKNKISHRGRAMQQFLTKLSR